MDLKKNKRQMTILIAAALAVTMFAGAALLSEDASGAVDYSYNAATNTLTVDGDSMPNYNSLAASRPWNAYAGTATKVIVQGTLTSIGNYAFSSFTALEEVVVTAPVTSISDYAFYNCTKLCDVDLPSGLLTIGSYTFRGCTSLASLDAPASLLTIGAYAFQTSGLETFTVPNSVTNITNAFNGCTALKSVTLGTGMTGVSTGAFQGCTSLTAVTIPNGYLSIDGNAFSGCTSLSSIAIPDSVTSIGATAFYNCTALTSLDLPADLVTIGTNAFQNCTKITEVTIPAGVTSLTGFQGCTSLTAIYFDYEAGITSIGDYALAGTRIASFTVPSNVLALGNNVFQNCVMLTSADLVNVTSVGNYTFYGCASLASYAFTNVTSVGNYTFYGCASLVSVDMGNITVMGMNTFQGCTSLTTVTGVYGSTAGLVITLPNYTFAGCTSLQTIAVPAGVTSVGQYAFQDCTSLTSVTFPNTVTVIQPNAFNGCSALVSVTLPINLETIGMDAFRNCTSLASIHIPEYVTTVTGFQGCTALASVTYEDDTNIIAFGDYAFAGTSFVTFDIPDSVTSVGQYAFQNCTQLTDVTMDGVTSLGNYVFSGCTSLATFTVPDGVTALGMYTFQDCTSLNDVDLNNITNIGTYTFYGCTSLASIDLPNGLTAIGNYVFSGCTSLVSIDLNNVTALGDYTFQNCTSLASVNLGNVATFGSSVFNGCPSFTSIAFSEGITVIPAAFQNNRYLESVTIPASATSIAAYAFAGCRSLKDVTFAPGSHMTTIGVSAFQECTSLESITLPDSVTTLGMLSFQVCTSLESIDLGKISDIGMGAFYNCILLAEVTFDPNTTLTMIDEYLFQGTTSLEEITIPASVTSIGQLAFGTIDYTSASGIERVTFAANSQLTSIGNYAFMGCKMLTSIDLPDSLVSIGGNAFSDSGLTSIHIPDSVTTLSINPFSGCLELERVTGGAGITSTPVNTSSGQNPFIGCFSLTDMDMTSGSYLIVYDNILYMRITATVGGSAVPALMVLCVPCGMTGTVTIQDSITVGSESLPVVSYDTGGGYGSIVRNGAMHELKADKIIFSANAPVIPNLIASMITEAVIPEGVTTLNRTFQDCINLKTVTLPSTLTTMVNTFSGSGLESIVIPDGVTTMTAAFQNCAYLKDVKLGFMLDRLTSGEFSGCTSLESIDLRYITSITSALGGCTSLKEIKFGIYLESINGSFSNCTALETIDLDGSALIVGAGAFSGCTSLRTINIGANVASFAVGSPSSVGTSSFERCTSIAEINLHPDNNYMLMFDDMVFTADMKTILLLSPSKSDVVIPNTVTKMPMFLNPANITSLRIGNGITDLSTNLRGMINLKYLSIGSGVTSIGELAATQGTLNSLETLILSDSLVSFTVSDLQYSPNLKSITFGKNLQNVGNLTLALSHLEEVIIHPENTYLIFDEDTGVLYNYLGKYLSHLPAETLTIPEGVTDIGGSNGTGINGNVQTLILSNSVTTIGTYGITCNPTVIIFGTGIQTFGVLSISNATDLTDMYFLGTNLPLFDPNFLYAGTSPKTMYVHSGIPGEFLSTTYAASYGYVFVFDSNMGYSVTLDTAQGVSVDSPPLTVMQPGTSTSFTISAMRGYEISVSASGGTLTDLGKNRYTLSAPTGNVIITVTSTPVDIGVISVAIDRPSVSLVVNGTVSLKAAVNPSDATHRNITWISSNTSVAAVDQNGLVTAISTGTAYITAMAPDGTAAVCFITVSPRVYTAENVTLDRDDITLGAGEARYLVATVAPSAAADKTVLWSSDKPDVAYVSGDGRVVGGSVGVTVVRASLPDGSASAECTVTITAAAQMTGPVTSIKFDMDHYMVSIGGNLQIRASLLPFGNTTDVKITVDGNAATAAATFVATPRLVWIIEVTPLRAGTVTITATTAEGLSDSCTVEVVKGKVLPIGDDLDVYPNVAALTSSPGASSNTSTFPDGTSMVRNNYVQGIEGRDTRWIAADGSSVIWYNYNTPLTSTPPLGNTSIVMHGYMEMDAAGNIVYEEGNIIWESTYVKVLVEFTAVNGNVVSDVTVKLAARDQSYSGDVAMALLDQFYVEAVKTIFFDGAGGSLIGTDPQISYVFDGKVSGLRTPATAVVSTEMGALRLIAGAGASLTIITDAGTITFDSDAVAAIASLSGADDDKVEFTLSKLDITTLTIGQRDRLGESPVFTLAVAVEGVQVSNLGGSASVTLMYVPKSGENVSEIEVWYLGANDVMVPMNCVVDVSSQTVSFVTDHFSDYAVVYTGYVNTNVPSDPAGPRSAGGNGGSGTDMMMIAVAIAVVAGIGAAVYFFVLRRH